MAILESLGFEFCFRFEDLRFGGCESVVETTQDDEREDDVLVFALCHGTVEVLCDFPKETGDAADILGVVGHGDGLSAICSNGNSSAAGIVADADVSNKLDVSLVRA